MLTFPTSPAHYAEYSAAANGARFLNKVLALHALAADSAGSGLVVPVGLAKDPFQLPGQARRLPGLQGCRPELDYHSSAALALALDTLSLPFRARTAEAAADMGDVARMLGASGRRVAALNATLPLAMEAAKPYLVDFLAGGGPALSSLTPGCPDAAKELRCQVVSLRGVDAATRFRPRDFKTSAAHSENPFQRCDSLRETVLYHLGGRFPRVASSVQTARTPINVCKPFPHIFDKRVTPSGLMGDSDRDENVGVDSVASLTSLQSSGGCGDLLNTVVARARRINLHKMHRFQEAGLEDDDFSEVLEGLEQLADCYKESDAF